MFSFSFTTRAQGHGIEAHVILFVHIFFIDNNSFMDKVYSHYIYLSIYLKVMNVHATERPNVHDNNLFDIKGLSYVSIMRFICVRCLAAKLVLRVVLRVKQKLTSHFQFFIKVLKFESRVSFLTLLRYAQFPTSDYLA